MSLARCRQAWHGAGGVLDTLVATWFGVGFVPFAPGTAGSLAALPLAWLVATYLGALGLAVCIALLAVIGALAAGRYARARGIADPGAVVVDEVAGQCLALLLVRPDLATYAIGFVLFRLFDVIKPWPISVLDRRVKGGLGVMLDDLVAGACAAILTWHAWIWMGG
jgi:phosphatidylglycerophosphatase A